MEQKNLPVVSPGAVTVSAESIAKTVRSLQLLKESIPNVLEKDVDYGHVKGIPGEMLFDCGASNIINFFNAYPGERKILHLRDDGEIIAVCVEVPLISRETGMVVGTGVAASSTQESKHKYRWIDNPLEWGYSQEAIDKWFKKDTRVEEGVIFFKIKNPEHSELLDIVIRQASKRAETDGARSLPGVGTALKLLLDHKLRKAPADKPDWPRFYGEISKLGFSQDEVHEKLGVKSVNDWLAQGKTLDQALNVLRRTGDAPAPPAAATPPSKPRRDPKTVKPEEVKSINDLYKVCNECFGLQPAAVVKELGLTTQADIAATPWDCWLQVMGPRAG